MSGVGISLKHKVRPRESQQKFLERICKTEEVHKSPYESQLQDGEIELLVITMASFKSKR